MSLIGTLLDAQRVVVRVAYAQSLRDMWILYTCTAGFGLLGSFFIGRQTLPALQLLDSKGMPAPDLELQSVKPS